MIQLTFGEGAGLEIEDGFGFYDGIKTKRFLINNKMLK
jgi:hypothetical protein